MHLVVLSDGNLKNELLAQATNSALNISWIADPQQLTSMQGADAYLDLLFDNTPERISLLQGLQEPVIINSVTYTLATTGSSFIRINGWRGFLHTAIVEA